MQTATTTEQETHADQAVAQLETHLEQLEAAGLTGICTIAQAMALADVSRRTIYNWMARGWIEVRFTPSGQRRVVISTLQSRVA